MSVRCTNALVDLPIACDTIIALMIDSRERIDRKILAGFAAATFTDNAPVSSAMRNLVKDTAVAVAPPCSGMTPSAVAIHATELAVPITPQVPAQIMSELIQRTYVSMVDEIEGDTDGASSWLIAEISSTSIFRALKGAQLFLQVCTSTYSRTFIAFTHHRASN
jgi:hypothetical protein